MGDVGVAEGLGMGGLLRWLIEMRVSHACVVNSVNEASTQWVTAIGCCTQSRTAGLAMNQPPRPPSSHPLPRQVARISMPPPDDPHLTHGYVPLHYGASVSAEKRGRTESRSGVCFSVFAVII